MIRLALTFLVLMLISANALAQNGLVLQSDWSNALGSSDAAVSDGGKWSDFFGNTSAKPVISVVGGGPGGLNALQMNVRLIPQGSGLYASQWGAVWRTDFPLNTADDVYYRFYAKMPNQHAAGFSIGNGHYVQDFHGANPLCGGGDCDGSQGNTWGHQSALCSNGTACTWRSYMASIRHNIAYYPELAGCYGIETVGIVNNRVYLNYDQWYRFEFHIKFLEHTKSSRTITETRVYDLNGQLIYDTDDMSMCGRTLSDWYAQGKHWIVEGRDPTLMLGFNGPWVYGPNHNSAITPTDDGISHSYASFEMRTDRWVGPDPRAEGTSDTTPPAPPSGFRIVP